MKILLVVLFALLSVSAFSQNDDLYFSKEKTGIPERANVDVAKTKNNSYLELSGKYLEKSAKYQYAAIGCAAVSVGTSVFAGISMTAKLPEDEQDPEKWYNDKRNAARTCYIVSGVVGVAAIICEFISIDYKLRSGRCIQLHASGNGVGVGVSF